MGSLKTGPVGYTKGEEWDHKGRTKIVQIITSYDHLSIKSLQFQYLENGHLLTSDIIGLQDFSSPVFDTAGPVGYAGGEKWDHKGRTNIVQIMISHDYQFLRSLQFQYLENGHLCTSDIIGRQEFNSPVFDTITFRDHEYITKLEGLYTSHNIEKLCIHTNIKKYELFEVENQPSNSEYSKRFSFNFGGGNQFGGFHGTHDYGNKYSTGRIRSIGAYFKRLEALPPGYFQGQPSDASGQDEVTDSV